MSDVTPPRGGASYALVDVGELAKRAADVRMENRTRLVRIEETLQHLIPLAEKIDLLARPVARPRYVNYAIVTCAIAAIIIATSSVVRTSTIIVDSRGTPSAAQK